MWEIKGYLYSPGAPHPLQLLRGASERGHRMTLKKTVKTMMNQTMLTASPFLLRCRIPVV